MKPASLSIAHSGTSDLSDKDLRKAIAAVRRKQKSAEQVLRQCKSEYFLLIDESRRRSAQCIFEEKRRIEFTKIQLALGREDKADQVTLKELRAARAAFGDLWNQPLSKLPLSGRTQQSLMSVGLETLILISKETDLELLRIPNFGRRSLGEITRLMRLVSLLDALS